MIFKKGVNFTWIPSFSVASITGVNMLLCSKDSKSVLTKRKIRGAEVECGFFLFDKPFYKSVYACCWGGGLDRFIDTSDYKYEHIL